MPRKPSWPPKVSRHSSGQARIYFGGRVYYLGVYGSPEAHAAYLQFLEQWEPGKTTVRVQHRGDTIATLASRYIHEYASQHYRTPEGLPSRQIEYVRRAVAVLVEVHGTTPAEQFRGPQLREVRERMIEKGWCRGNVNAHVNQIKRLLRWCCSEDLYPADCLTGVNAVAGLRAGRTPAPDHAPIRCVPLAVVESTLPHLSETLRTAVQVQLYTAARPGEVLGLRVEDIDQTGGIWIARLGRHKTRHHGQGRTLLMGPRCQEILRPWIDRVQTGCLFSPRGERRGKAERYDVRVYAKQIRRICTRHQIPAWSPHQLRHTAATQLSAEFGIELARIILGHSSLSATLVYAENDLKKAMEAMKKIG